VVKGVAIGALTYIAAPIALGVAAMGLSGIISSVGISLSVGLGVGSLGAVVGSVVGGLIHGSWEGALRGALIGFTAGANFAVGSMLFGPVAGAALGVVTFLSIIPPIRPE
jgi:hypothetical protein